MLHCGLTGLPADFLEALGANLDLPNDKVAQVIDQCGFGFLFAQKFHPCMRHVAAVRKEIGVRTVFNLLGPLSNPAAPEFQVTGVASPELGPIFAEVFVQQGKTRGLVVNSSEGMNEISPQGETTGWMVQEGKVEVITLTPKSFGLEPVPLNSEGILGGTAEERAALLRRVFDGEHIPLRNFLVVNAAAALWVAGKAESLLEAATLAQTLIDGGAAKKKLDEYVQATQTAAGNKKRPRA